MTFGMGMPEHTGRNFHHEAGHLTIASLALSELMDLRSIVLGVKPPACTVKDKFTFSYPQAADKNTQEEHDYVITLSNDILAFSKDQCIESMKKLINSCDTKDGPID
ncbi:hypothetical protein PtrSN002B_008231 [Pyrenophora tritici-repentis]|uniref:Uncharacterized protein n=2 Tax=Pyrenophora tritici-repentis TaxID=45151 RepID=A0A2W1FLR0_9PLEO|nr:uncharacterized protein PTRG_10189 [Pyrenophora tritici-repentis Pt-1C-BFP]KAA8620801.1 hypothetical protein PtrV1_05302 [Pyrenophora tritici-repentis]EDU43240.1 conserved hypothetical protein [Pyrenophora tritici-repentis Pt-1C-BFP]KAF7450046.1 hypothetical protein A1F99_046620 [Pyrenophora tritici-repentis]KAF7572612.1 hypothetical protein PtrM4_075170 [Pyrenophora tritici-repentis]KAG9376021.1 hypothetical protein A1F94_013287 [Pyrenophora tritici-repentis]